jgi:hypothetical protein
VAVILYRRIMEKIRRKEIRFHLGGLGRKIYLIRGYKYGFKYCRTCDRMYYMPDAVKCPFGHRLRHKPRNHIQHKLMLKTVKRVVLSRRAASPAAAHHSAQAP